MWRAYGGCAMNWRQRTRDKDALRNLIGIKNPQKFIENEL